VLYTEDGGLNWTEYASPARIGIRDFHFADEQVGYLVGHSGMIMKTTTGGLTNIEEDALAGQALSTYPNPFHSETSIEFTLESPGKVQLQVFNLNGQQLVSLERTFSRADRRKLSLMAVNGPKACIPLA
jgi:hypothetical protein